MATTTTQTSSREAAKRNGAQLRKDLAKGADIRGGSEIIGARVLAAVAKI